MLLLTRPYGVVERFHWLPRRILSDVNDRRGVGDVKAPDEGNKAIIDHAAAMRRRKSRRLML